MGNASQTLRDIFDKACDEAISVLQSNCQHKDKGIRPILYTGSIPFHGDDVTKMERRCTECDKKLESYTLNEYYDKFLSTEAERQARLDYIMKHEFNPEFVAQYKGTPVLVHLASAMDCKFPSYSMREGDKEPTTEQKRIMLKDELGKITANSTDGRRWYYLTEF